IFGTFKVLGSIVSPAYLRSTLEFLFQVGKYGMIAVAAFSLFAYVKNFKGTTLLKTVFFFTLVFFFVPIWLSPNINVAFLSYAVAHGLQYIAFMSVVSFNTKSESTSPSIPYRSIGMFLLFLF